jgi:hypothetical protein
MDDVGGNDFETWCVSNNRKEGGMGRIERRRGGSMTE